MRETAAAVCERVVLQAAAEGRLQRFGRLWREGGLKHVCLKALWELRLYRCCIIDSSPVDRPRPGDATIPVDCAPLTAEDVDAYAAFRPEQPRPVIAERLERGDWCHVAWHDGHIVGTTWTALSGFHIADLGCAVGFDARTYMAYDNYVRPDFRGHHIHLALSVARRRDLQAAGYHLSLGIIWPVNSAAYRAIRRMGNPQIGWIGYVGSGPWRRHFLRLDPECVDVQAPPLWFTKCRISS